MLPRPQRVDNDEGDVEWVFLYYSNKLTGKVTWTPPPPPGILENEDDAMDVEPILASKQNLSSMKSFVITPPPAEAYARELTGEGEQPADAIIPINLEEEEETVALTPAQLTFTGMLTAMLYMNPKGEQPLFRGKAREVGVNPDGLTHNQLIKALYDSTSLKCMKVR